MSAAVRATVLVAAALAGGIVAVWVSIANSGEAQDFWREQMQPARHWRDARRAPRYIIRKHHRTPPITRTAETARKPYVVAAAPLERVLPMPGAIVIRPAALPPPEHEPRSDPKPPPPMPIPPVRRPGRDERSGARKAVVIIAVVGFVSIITAFATIPKRGISYGFRSIA